MLALLQVATAVIGLLLVVPIVMLVPARAQTSGHSENTASVTASTCRAYYEDALVHDGPVQLATVHLNVGICRTGSGYVREWGPDCTVSGSVVWGGGTTWCGVYGESQGGAQPGADFYLYPFSPGSRKGGSLRLVLAPDGTATVAAWY
jgi:hypothetical protein